MKINPQLVRWLESEMASDTTRIGVYEGSNYQMYQQMIFTCLHADLIEFDEWTSDVVYYKLTALGEIALGIPAAASEPDTATGEYTAVRDNVFRGDTQIAFFGVGADSAAELLNTETAALRAELQAARERIAVLESEVLPALKRELEISREVRMSLREVIEQAAEALQGYNGEEFSTRVIRAKEILAPYTDPKDDRL